MDYSSGEAPTGPDLAENPDLENLEEKLMELIAENPGQFITEALGVCRQVKEGRYGISAVVPSAVVPSAVVPSKESPDKLRELIARRETYFAVAVAYSYANTDVCTELARELAEGGDWDSVYVLLFKMSGGNCLALGLDQDFMIEAFKRGLQSGQEREIKRFIRKEVKGNRDKIFMSGLVAVARIYLGREQEDDEQIIDGVNVLSGMANSALGHAERNGGDINMSYLIDLPAYILVCEIYPHALRALSIFRQDGVPDTLYSTCVAEAFSLLKLLRERDSNIRRLSDLTRAFLDVGDHISLDQLLVEYRLQNWKCIDLLPCIIARLAIGRVRERSEIFNILDEHFIDFVEVVMTLFPKDIGEVLTTLRGQLNILDKINGSALLEILKKAIGLLDNDEFIKRFLEISDELTRVRSADQSDLSEVTELMRRLRELA